MASVFLSYDHDDEALAAPIAAALERAGHVVWWDRQIHGGAQYNSEIESAVAECDIVVVLWSQRSVQSAWVRDEAAEGRDCGKLVPVMLDGSKPPMGFRQYQAVDLSGWKGRGKHPHLTDILASIDRVAGKGPSRSAPAVPAASLTDRARAMSSTARLAIVAIVVIASIVTARYLVGDPVGSEIPTVGVTAADDSAQNKALARDLFVNLGRLQAADTDALQLVQASSGRKPDFAFQISDAAERPGANIALVGRHGVLLWSKDFENSPDQLGNLKQQMGVTAARVLGCAKEAVISEGNRLDQQTLRLFLGGCADLAELSGSSDREVQRVIPVFEQVTKRSPKFQAAWGKLLVAEADVMANSALSEQPAIERALRKHIAAARELNPRMPEVLEAEILLVPPAAVTRRMEFIEKAIALYPDNPELLSLQSELLMAVGRMNAAVQAAKRAADFDALSPAAHAAYAYALVHSGQIQLAQNELSKFEAMWPDAGSLKVARFTINLRYGDPARALEQMRTGGFRSDVPVSQESFLQARLNPTRENVERALAVASGRQRETLRPMIQVFSQFGREREVIDRLLAQDVNVREQFTDVLFRPNTRKLRRDPRFVLVAKRFGLLDYWVKTGKWPDFCFEPDLPYDCKAEAAKIARAPA
jgi:tetratricopeptide (TPR) repeat protein